MNLPGSQDKTLHFDEKQLILLFCIAISLIFYASLQYRTEKMSVFVEADEVMLRQVRGELLFAGKHETNINIGCETRVPELTPFFFEPVPINSADQSLLITLPGIGPAMADRIIQYRNQHGSFTAIEQLRNISGIGEKRSAQLANHISFK